MNLNIKNIDTTKADLGLRHEYIPQTAFNKKQRDDEKIVVECEYLKIGEKVKYTTTDEDGNATLDFRKMFKQKVLEIRNLKINETPVVGADELLKYPGTLDLEALVIDVYAHLLNADSLNEDERKN